MVKESNIGSKYPFWLRYFDPIEQQPSPVIIKTVIATVYLRIYMQHHALCLNALAKFVGEIGIHYFFRGSEMLKMAKFSF